MGPLVPDLISPNLNYIAALLIGILFGAILEQAGFSTSKKLVGLFYGYDFTVLRVFFTAGITAMVGLMVFARFGLIDMNLVYINPTFLWSAIIGGLIMGLGFVLGGFCPGTSVCAAAIGKIDAMIFIVGSFFGVLIFAEGYPAFESLYKAKNLGSPRIFETLNISQNLFAFLTVFVALFAFYAVSLVEKRVNKEKIEFFKINKQNILMASFGCILLIASLTLTDRKNSLMKLVEDENFVKKYPLEEMTTDELAFRLTCQKCEHLRIIDLRNQDEYNKWSLPNSTLFTLDNLFEKEPNLFLRLKHTKRVFVANDELTERKAAIMALKMGYKDIKILKGGLQGFEKDILNFEPLKEPKTLDEQYTNRFRSKAKIEIAELIKNNKPQGPVQKTQKRALGGC